jgi:LysM repeat protein
MKRILSAVVLFLSFLVIPLAAGAQQEEPTVYVVKKGDTLWGLSDRFIKDPFYWPNLWARNQSITNPHLIYPGQILHIYPDRIEIVEKTSPPQPAPPEQVVPERTFTVSGAEGFVMEADISPVGTIIQTNHDRLIVGREDVVYTDVGSSYGAKSGDAYSLYKKMDAVRHPVTGEFLGYKMLALGCLRLTDMEEKSSRAVITKSYLEIGPGAWLLPYRDKRIEIPLKAAKRDLDGYIVESRLGNITIGDADVVYLDLGRAHGLELGNMLYVVRDVAPNPDYVTRDVGNLPKEVLGAVVVVELGERTSSALVVKSVEAIRLGDQVKLISNQ